MILKFGDKGLKVNNLQRRLFYAGYKILIDGYFGHRTMAVIKQVQKRFGLIQDGVYDYRVDEILNDNSAAFFIKEKDIIELSAQYEIEPAVLSSLIAVYASRDYVPKKIPLIFERDVFYRLLTAKKINIRELAKKQPNIISPDKGGYIGSKAEYLRLSQATQINEELALQSARYGFFYIPGTAFKKCGFDNITELIDYLKVSEKNQLKVFLDFLQSEELLQHLKKLDFENFAKSFDSEYYQNLHDVLLSRNYEAHQHFYPTVKKQKMSETQDAEAK